MSELSRLKALVRQYAANPQVQAGLATIDKAIDANPLVIFDGKKRGYDESQYKAFLAVEAAREAKDTRRNPFQSVGAQDHLNALTGKPSRINPLFNARVAGANQQIGSYGMKALQFSYKERQETLEETLNSLPDGQRQLTQEYYRLQKLYNDVKSAKFDALDALKIGVSAFVTAGFGAGLANLFTGVNTAATTAGNVAKGINFAEAAAPGVNLASPTIGTGVKISGAAFDAALAKTAASGVLGSWSLTDVTKTAGNVFKGASAVSKLAGAAGSASGEGGGGTSSTGGGGAVNISIPGLEMPTTQTTTPIGAKTDNGATPPVIDFTSGGGGNGNSLPLLILAGIGLYFWSKS